MQAITAYKRLDLKKARKAARKLSAIDHSLRKRILLYLRWRGPATVTEIWIYFRIDQSIMSGHLAVLRRAGWVTTERQGKHIYYSINESEIDRVTEILSKFNKS